MKMMMLRRALGSARRQIHAVATTPSSQTHVLSKEIIKPSSPTPSHLKNFRLSSLDQFSTRKYMPLIFFYPNHGGDNSPSKAAEKSQSLKSSLTQTLTQYYPFAGRLTGGVSVDCNDQGVEFVEARINCGLSEVLQNPEHEALDQAFPPGSVWGDPYEGSASPMVVQINHFDCGGIGLAVSMTHKIADGTTFCNLLNYWAAVARQSGDQVTPHYVYDKGSADTVTVPEIELGTLEGSLTRRFFFSNSKIAELKATVAAQGVQNPTRVQVLTALLFKSALAAAAEKAGSFIPSALSQFVNMRPKMATPLPQTSLGNFYTIMSTLVKNESDSELRALAEQLNKDKMQIKSGVEKLDANDILAKLGESLGTGAELYMCTSMCRFPFSQLDFGWGQPVKVSLREACNKNLFVLMDTATGDGIEATVNLQQERMPAFEHDKELLAFAS